MKKFSTFVYFLLLALIVSAQDKSKIIDINVLPYKSVTNQAFFKSLVLMSDESSLEFIDNFSFEWGYYYKLKVKKTELASPPMDGSSVEYDLVKVVSKRKASQTDTFELLLTAYKYLGPPEAGDERMLKATSDSTYLYDGEIEIIIPNEYLAKFRDAFIPDKRLIGKFVFAPEGRIRLVGFK